MTHKEFVDYYKKIYKRTLSYGEYSTSSDVPFCGFDTKGNLHGIYFYSTTFAISKRVYYKNKQYGQSLYYKVAPLWEK